MKHLEFNDDTYTDICACVREHGRARVCVRARVTLSPTPRNLRPHVNGLLCSLCSTNNEICLYLVKKH